MPHTSPNMGYGRPGARQPLATQWCGIRGQPLNSELASGKWRAGHETRVSEL